MTDDEKDAVLACPDCGRSIFGQTDRGSEDVDGWCGVHGRVEDADSRPPRSPGRRLDSVTILLDADPDDYP